MTLAACGPTYQDGLPGGFDILLSTPAEVERFVEYLAQPWVSTAMIQSATVACDVHVEHGFGYLFYAGRDQETGAWSMGDPASPEIATEDQEFPLGSGVSIEALTEALVELLETGRRPTNIQWQEYRSIHQDAG